MEIALELGDENGTDIMMAGYGVRLEKSRVGSRNVYKDHNWKRLLNNLFQFGWDFLDTKKLTWFERNANVLPRGRSAFKEGAKDFNSQVDGI